MALLWLHRGYKNEMVFWLTGLDQGFKLSVIGFSAGFFIELFGAIARLFKAIAARL